MEANTIYKASDLMTADNKAKMIALKAEYSKLSTSAKRMKEIYVEMTELRKTVE